MVHTVGLMGANGRVGRAALEYLAQSAKGGKINLVVLHRAGSPPKFESSGNIVTRTVDLDGPTAQIDAAVKGINTFISAVGFGALRSEPNIVKALARSPDTIVYIPSVYSTTWTADDHKDPSIGPVLQFLHAGWNKALELGVAVTPVYVGAFEDYFFDFAFIGSSIKQNLVWANEKQMRNRIPITAIQHLGKVLGQVGTADPHSIKGTQHSVVTFWPSGQEIADLYFKINGKPAIIQDFTRQDREAQMADGANFGPAKVGYWDRWEAGQWGYSDDGRIVHDGYEGPAIEELARRYA